MPNKTLQEQYIALQKQLEAIKKEKTESDTELEKKKLLIKQMQQLLARQQSENETIAGERDEALNEARELSAPPQSYGTVIRTYDQEVRADVSIGGSEQLVAINPSIDISLLTRGTRVRITSGHAIDAIAPHQDELGEILTFSRTLSEDVVVVEDAAGHTMTALLTHGIDISQLSNEDEVVVSDGFVIEVVKKKTENDALGFAANFALPELPNTTFADIAGQEDLIERILWGIRAPNRMPERFAHLKLPAAFRSLFWGPPGCGKTSIAKAIARYLFEEHQEQILKYAKGNFIYIAASELSDKWVGGNEKHFKACFAGASRLAELSGAPVVMFFDDCDALLRERGSQGYSTASEINVNIFNAIVDGARELHPGVSIILASNRPDIMDGATLRRMTTMHEYVSPPDTPERVSKVLGVHLKPEQIVPGQDPIGVLTERLFANIPENNILEITFRGESSSEIYTLPRFLSGGLLEAMVSEAKRNAIKHAEATLPEEELALVSEADILKALELKLDDKTIPTAPEKVWEWLTQHNEGRTPVDIVPLKDKKVRAQLEKEQERIKRFVD